MTDWLIWGFLLVLQNASHTASSRAKNSRSLRYSAATGVFSNGVWFLSLFFTLNLIDQAKGRPLLLAFVGTFYVAMTVGGTVLSHWWLMRFEDRRALRV